MIFACISFFGIMSKRTFCLHYCTESFTWIAWVHSFRPYIPFFDHFQLISVCGELGEWNAFSQCDLLMSIPAWKDMKAVLKISWLNILNLSSRKQKCLTWSSWKKQNSLAYMFQIFQSVIIWPCHFYPAVTSWQRTCFRTKLLTSLQPGSEGGETAVLISLSDSSLCPHFLLLGFMSQQHYRLLMTAHDLWHMF